MMQQSDRDRPRNSSGHPRPGFGVRGHPRQGQSTLEYILVLSAILVGLIVIVSTTIKPAVEGVMTDSQTTITNASAKVQGGLGLP